MGLNRKPKNKNQDLVDRHFNNFQSREVWNLYKKYKNVTNVTVLNINT